MVLFFDNLYVSFVNVEFCKHIFSEDYDVEADTRKRKAKDGSSEGSEPDEEYDSSETSGSSASENDGSKKKEKKVKEPKAKRAKVG